MPLSFSNSTLSMRTKFKPNVLAYSVAIVIAGCAGSNNALTAPPPNVNSNAPVISPEVQSAAAKLANDASIQAIVAEWRTASHTQARFDQHLELVRIASPSRSEYNRALEIKRRMVEEWGFLPGEIKTRDDGTLPGSDVQIVDGLPVYNICAEIKGSYSSSAGAVSYRGQYPKVLVESHIDTVNPEKLTYRYEPVKLQPIGLPIVATPAALAALPDELVFDANGRIVRDANYLKARQYYASAEAATAAGATRIYVPGYGDAMSNVSAVMNIAKAMKKHNIKPVYDVWFCGTAGEEGKGNLAGMKQLYGYDQNLGTGSNPLNFVTNFGIDGASGVVNLGTINFIGSYRFEMKYSAPAAAGSKAPSALKAAAASIARIADIKTAWDIDKTALKTTYTVGVANCEPPAADSAVVPSCTIQVDMRSPRLEPLRDIRSRIEPLFQAGVSEENARYSVADASAQAVKLELVWFGDRPPHERTDKSDVSIQAAWQSALTVGVDQLTELPTSANSLNDNVPAAIGVPTINLSIDTGATGGGAHSFWEWGVPGDSAKEVLRLQRVMTAALIASGFQATDGSIVAPAAPAMGKRTSEVR